MGIIDVHLQDVILTEDGRDRAKFFIQQFLPQKLCVINFQRNENFKFFVIFMDIVEEKIYLCMVVMSLMIPNKQDYFHL